MIRCMDLAHFCGKMAKNMLGNGLITKEMAKESKSAVNSLKNRPIRSHWTRSRNLSCSFQNKNKKNKSEFFFSLRFVPPEIRVAWPRPKPDEPRNVEDKPRRPRGRVPKLSRRRRHPLCSGTKTIKHFSCN